MTEVTNHVIREMIGITVIEVREIIDDTTTIVAENLLNPNREGPFHTMSRGRMRPTNSLIPRLHESPRTTHTLPHKITEERQATRFRLTVSNVTNGPLCYPIPDQ